MKNQVKKFSQYIKESDEMGMGKNVSLPFFASQKGGISSRSPQVGDEVFVAGFADDAGIVINSYAGYGKIIEARNGKYDVEFESIFDSSGISDNAPKEISFSDRDIVSGERGSWAVVKHSMQFF